MATHQPAEPSARESSATASTISTGEASRPAYFFGTQRRKRREDFSAASASGVRRRACSMPGDAEASSGYRLRAASSGAWVAGLLVMKRHAARRARARNIDEGIGCSEAEKGSVAGGSEVAVARPDADLVAPATVGLGL